MHCGCRFRQWHWPECPKSVGRPFDPWERASGRAVVVVVRCILEKRRAAVGGSAARSGREGKDRRKESNQSINRCRVGRLVVNGIKLF